MTSNAILSFVSAKSGGQPYLLVGPCSDRPRLAGDHVGPVALDGARTVMVVEDVVFDPYANRVCSLEIRLQDGEGPGSEDIGDGIERLAVGEALRSTRIHLHPAERFFLRKFAQDGTHRFGLSAQKSLWENLRGVEGDQCGPDLWVLPVRTPTIPPARHTNMVVIKGPGLVVDPGAHEKGAREKALSALHRLGEVAGPLQAIWLTHHHSDHAGGAEWLASRTSLPIWAHPITAELLQGQMKIDRVFEHGQEVPTPEGQPSGWSTVHTPGHAAGHLCLWHEESRRLVAGDMMAGVGTILVDPSDGDMGLYIRSLEGLVSMLPSAAIPAHGPMLCDATGSLKFYVAHRLEREGKILAAIPAQECPMDEVLAQAYDDVAPIALPFAARSLESHVRKLEQEGKVRRNDQGRVFRL